MVTNIVVREKRPFEQMDQVGRLVAEAETELKAQGGRVFLRYSGTEPKARLLIEGQDTATLEKWTKRISEIIKSQVGSVGASAGTAHRARTTRAAVSRCAPSRLASNHAHSPNFNLRLTPFVGSGAVV